MTIIENLKKAYMANELLTLSLINPRTEEQSQRLRSLMLSTYKESHPEHATPDLTCDTCSDRHSCEYAFDLYNTDGDCLASK